MILLAAQLVLLLLVCCCGPGLLLVGRLRWSPMEKLCGAFAASFIFIYLASFVLFCLNAGTGAYWAVTGFFGLMGIAGWRTVALFIHRRETRTVLLVFVVVASWEFLHLAMIHAYGGGGWGGDWHEHYDRTRFFLHQLPVGYQFLGRYSLAARPPMMNLMAAFFCRQVGLSFEAFSLVFLVLNAWAFVPCGLLLRRIAPRGRGLEWVLAALFMLNPSIMQNATYTWTKAFAAGWVVMGVCFYMRRRIGAAAISLAAGMLVHYSAAPFALAVGLHCFFSRFWRIRELPRAIAAALAGVALLATWFVWSVWYLGIKTTFASPALTSGAPDDSVGENIRRIAYNLFTSLVPHVLHSMGSDPNSTVLRNVHNWRNLRDYYFTMAQTSLPTMIGLTGGVIVAGVVLRMFWRGNGLHVREKGFWLFFLLFGCVVGTAANDNWDAPGSAHLALQPLALMGVTLLAAWLPSARPALFRVVMVGLAVDYCLGILLHFNRESLVPQAIVSSGQLDFILDPEIGRNTINEYTAKLHGGYVFWGDHLAEIGPALQLASIVTAVGLLWILSRAHTANKNHKLWK